MGSLLLSNSSYFRPEIRSPCWARRRPQRPPHSRRPPKADILTGPDAVGDRNAATETSSPPQFDDVVYRATGFTFYTHDIALCDIHLRGDLSNRA